MRDRDLVRLYWPAELRGALDALLDIDEAMGDVVARSTEPALAAIKLAWWRERLQELDEGKVPAEPRLQAAAIELLPRGVTGSGLAAIEDGWATLLEEQPDIERIGGRGVRLFDIGAKLLKASDPLLKAAGRLFGYASAARRLPESGFWAMEEMHQLAGHRFSSSLRPLTALTRLATRDVGRQLVEREATPGRAMALLRHRFTGRVA